MADEGAREAGQATMLLARLAAGDTPAGDQLFLLVRDELQRLARGQMKRQGAAHTLQPTALVHEAWIRMVGGDDAPSYRGREHFLAVASSAMRSALVDHARKKKTEKRGGGRERQPLDDAVAQYEERGQDLVALDAALEKLAAEEPRQARVIELRFFGGLTIEDAASVMEVSHSTVERDWHLARAWLKQELDAGDA